MSTGNQYYDDENLEMAHAEIELLEKQLADAKAEIALLRWRLKMADGLPNHAFLDMVSGL